MKKIEDKIIKTCKECFKCKAERNDSMVGICTHQDHQRDSENPDNHAIFDIGEEIDPTCPLPDYELTKEEKQKEDNLLKEKIDQAAAETALLAEKLLPSVSSVSKKVINIEIGSNDSDVILNIKL